MEYWKSFANEEDRYPSIIMDMVDVMRKMPEKKRKETTKPPGKEKEKDKEKDTSASSFSTKEKSGEKKEDDERACYC